MGQKFTWVKAAAAGVLTLVAGLLGGWDLALKGLLTFMALDYATAVLRALAAGKWDSSVGLTGILRKLAQLIGVAAAHAADVYLFGGEPWARTLACAAFMLNEAGSVAGHLAALGVPLPDAIHRALQTEVQRKRGKVA